MAIAIGGNRCFPEGNKETHQKPVRNPSLFFHGLRRTLVESKELCRGPWTRSSHRATSFASLHRKNQRPWSFLAKSWHKIDHDIVWSMSDLVLTVPYVCVSECPYSMVFSRFFPTWGWSMQLPSRRWRRAWLSWLDLEFGWCWCVCVFIVSNRFICEKGQGHGLVLLSTVNIQKQSAARYWYWFSFYCGQLCRFGCTTWLSPMCILKVRSSAFVLFFPVISAEA